MEVQNNGGHIPQGSPDTLGGKDSVNISEAFEAYRQVCVFKNQSKKTEENLVVCKRALLAYFGNVPITSLSFPLIRLWKQELEKTRSPETVRNYIIKLRVVLRYCKDQGVSVTDPDEIPVPQRRDKVPVFLTSEQVTKLIDSTSNIRNKALISLLYASGVRISECCRLNKGDIVDGAFTVVGKGGKARLCFIDKRTHDLLNIYLTNRQDNNQALFTGKFNSHRITPGNIQEIFRIARKNAQIPHATPHTMRHSFSTNFLRNNGNMRYLQDLLGHSSLETTQMYAHVTNPDLQREYKKHHTI